MPRHRLGGLQRLETRDCPSSYNALTMFGPDGGGDFTSNFAMAVMPDTDMGRPPISGLSISVDGRQIGGGTWIISGSVSGVDEVGGLAVQLSGSNSAFGEQSATTSSDGSYGIMWVPPANFQGCSVSATVTVRGATASASTSIG
ncbi:MAG TPA: hypothetical protein VL371_07745 [Gemmataceae bacterium]|jgi:hypothetical protein|nr:hypothetical protein [Gemmataceae bacterium]